MSRIFKSIQMNEKEKKVINYQHNLQHTVEQLEEHDEHEAKKEDHAVRDAEEIAEKIIDQAKNEAEDLKSQANQEIAEWWKNKRIEDQHIMEESKEIGYQEGYSDGLKAAEQEMKQKYANMLADAQGVLESAYQVKERIIAESEPQVLELSLKVAKKLVLKELETDPDTIKQIAQDALKNTKEYEKITIMVSPNDFAYLQSGRDELLNELNGQVELLIYPDHKIINGGCMIKTSTGTIDATIDTKLEEIKSILYDVLGRGQTA